MACWSLDTEKYQLYSISVTIKIRHFAIEFADYGVQLKGFIHSLLWKMTGAVQKNFLCKLSHIYGCVYTVGFWIEKKPTQKLMNSLVNLVCEGAWLIFSFAF